jgi:hypothetical protein
MTIDTSIQSFSGSYSNGWLQGADSATQKQSGGAIDKKSHNAEGDRKAQQEVQKLKNTEQKVIAHEMAHKAVGGQYAGSVKYEYTRGPDNKMYIAGGEVSIDVSKGSTPEETAQKMRQVQQAAMAPADPSAQDRAVAAKAAMQAQKAQQEIQSEQQKEQPSAAVGYTKKPNQSLGISIYG